MINSKFYELIYDIDLIGEFMVKDLIQYIFAWYIILQGIFEYIFDKFRIFTKHSSLLQASNQYFIEKPCFTQYIKHYNQ